MLEKKRIYISDVHMNAGKSLELQEGKYPYEWLSRKEADRFSEFLRYLNTLNDVKEIVFLGDLLDNWVYPVDIVPPSYQEIIDANINKAIVSQLKQLARKRLEVNDTATVLYLPGNHDMGVTKQFVEQNFPGMIFAGSALRNSAYRTGRLLAEHGSGYAMFNAPDSINSPGNRLPLGYFISRIVATKSHNTGTVNRHYWTYADDLLEMLGPQKLAASVFESLLEEAELSESTEICMAYSKQQEDSMSKAFDMAQSAQGDRKVSITARSVKEKYASLYDQWTAQYGPGYAFKSIMAEIGLLGRVADDLCKKNDTNIVVFGHSHDWELDKDSWFVDDRIYANAGCWCDEDKMPTFIESQKDPDRRQHIVRAVEWKDGKPYILKEEAVGY